MTPLQTLRNTLNDGVSISLSKQTDGYHILCSTLDADGRVVTWETVDCRLEQAIHRMQTESPPMRRVPFRQV